MSKSYEWVFRHISFGAALTFAKVSVRSFLVFIEVAKCLDLFAFEALFFILFVTRRVMLGFAEAFSALRLGKYINASWALVATVNLVVFYF